MHRIALTAEALQPNAWVQMTAQSPIIPSTFVLLFQIPFLSSPPYSLLKEAASAGVHA